MSSESVGGGSLLEEFVLILSGLKCECDDGRGGWRGVFARSVQRRWTSRRQAGGRGSKVATVDFLILQIHAFKGVFVLYIFIPARLLQRLLGRGYHVRWQSGETRDVNAIGVPTSAALQLMCE